MIKHLCIILLSVMIIPLTALSQDKQKDKPQEYKLTSENLDNEGRNLDSQIHELNQKIIQLVKRDNLFTNEKIKVLPFRFSYSIKKDTLALEHYIFIKDDIYNRDIVGVKSKSLTMYAGGDGVGRIDYRIYENNHFNEVVTEVLIGDPSPSSAGTDDMIFTHKKNKRMLLDAKKLGEVKNSTAFPLRNDIKREFIIPHLTYFYNSLLYITEAYYKSLKDSDSQLSEFLKKSTNY